MRRATKPRKTVEATTRELRDVVNIVGLLDIIHGSGKSNRQSPEPPKKRQKINDHLFDWPNIVDNGLSLDLNYVTLLKLTLPLVKNLIVVVPFF